MDQKDKKLDLSDVLICGQYIIDSFFPGKRGAYDERKKMPGRDFNSKWLLFVNIITYSSQMALGMARLSEQPWRSQSVYYDMTSV